MFTETFLYHNSKTNVLLLERFTEKQEQESNVKVYSSKLVDISKKNAIFVVIFYYKSFLKTTSLLIYLPNKHFLQNTHVYFAGLLSID